MSGRLALELRLVGHRLDYNTAWRWKLHVCLCRSEVGNPPANVIWYKAGIEFGDVGTEKQTSNLFDVGKVDNQNHKCEATSNPH